MSCFMSDGRIERTGSRFPGDSHNSRPSVSGHFTILMLLLIHIIGYPLFASVMKTIHFWSKNWHENFNIIQFLNVFTEAHSLCLWTRFGKTIRPQKVTQPPHHPSTNNENKTLKYSFLKPKRSKTWHKSGVNIECSNVGCVFLLYAAKHRCRLSPNNRHMLNSHCTIFIFIPINF